jgi:hypothetical protein
VFIIFFPFHFGLNHTMVLHTHDPHIHFNIIMLRAQSENSFSSYIVDWAYFHFTSMGVLDQQEGPTRHRFDLPNKEEGSEADQEAWGDLDPEPLAFVGVDKEAGKPIVKHRVQVGGRAYPACVGVGEAKNRSSADVGEDNLHWTLAEDNDPEHLGHGEGGRSCLVGDNEAAVGVDVDEGEGSGRSEVPEACRSFRVSD